MSTTKRTTGAVLKKALPGKVQVQINHYDRAKRVYRAVPGLSTIIEDVKTPGEVRKLTRAIGMVIHDGLWRDGARVDGAGAGVDDSVAQAAPVTHDQRASLAQGRM